MEKISEKSVQHGLERHNTGKLQTLWLEIPAYCNLACSYCYACSGQDIEKNKFLPWKLYKSVLEQAAKMGVDSLGIPGAGEPLIKKNLQLTMNILRLATKLEMYITLFTTGEFLTEELADELYKLPVEIMLKGNTLNPSMQDKFVSDPKRGRIIKGFGLKRNAAIELLMQKGFNDETRCIKKFGRKSRIALVTSIMADEGGEVSNLGEIADILRFCRTRNIIFDCDTVLKRGRGATCTLCVEDEQIKNKLLELQQIDREEFDNIWEISQSYVGTTCDRHFHHMYVSQYGDIRPCIGAMDVSLGNIRDIYLRQAWDSREMKIIRSKKYHGKCADECANFAEGKCNSCLGRRTVDLNNGFLLTKGYVQTIGCWNFRRKN